MLILMLSVSFRMSLMEAELRKNSKRMPTSGGGGGAVGGAGDAAAGGAPNDHLIQVGA